MRRLSRLLPLAPIAALIVALANVTIPAFSVSPGTAKDVLPLIEIEGATTYPVDGRLLLTTVNLGRVDVFTALRDWLDPAAEVVPEREIVPPGRTEEEQEEISQGQMDESKIAAVFLAASRTTDYPEEHGPGILVQDVLRGSAADGRLTPGDVILAVDGRPVGEVDEVSEAIRATGGRRPLTLTVEAGGEERQVTVRPRVTEGQDKPILGVVLVANFPFDVSIDSGAIGGPSAGLMWTIGVYDLLSPGDLLADREVAGTGAVDLEGNVLPIGGIEQKVRTAERAGAELFLLPKGNLEEARTVAEEIQLVPVRSVAEAIRALRRADG